MHMPNENDVYVDGLNSKNGDHETLSSNSNDDDDVNLFQLQNIIKLMIMMNLREIVLIQKVLKWAT